MNARIRFGALVVLVVLVNAAVFYLILRPAGPHASQIPVLSKLDPQTPVVAAAEKERSATTMRVIIRAVEDGTGMTIPLFEWAFAEHGTEDEAALDWQTMEAFAAPVEIPLGDASHNARVLVRAPGYATGEAAIPRGNAPPDPLPLVVTLRPEITVQLADASLPPDQSALETGAKVRGLITIGGIAPETARIFIDIEDHRGIRHTLTPGYAEGKFEIANVPLGQGELAIDASMGLGQWRSFRETLAIPSARTYELTLDFPPAGVITGTLQGVPEQGVGGVLVCEGQLDTSRLDIEAIYALGGMAVGEARPDENGMFRVEGLDPSRYTVIGLAEFHYDDEEGQPRTAFWYDTEVVDVAAGGETTVVLDVQ